MIAEHPLPTTGVPTYGSVTYEKVHVWPLYEISGTELPDKLIGHARTLKEARIIAADKGWRVGDNAIHAVMLPGGFYTDPQRMRVMTAETTITNI